MSEEMSRKTLMENNRALTKLVIALLRPVGEAADDILKMPKPTRLIEEIWTEARMAIQLARRFQNDPPNGKSARGRGR